MIEIGFLRPEQLHLMLIVPLLVFFYFLFYSFHKRKTIPFANYEVVQRIAKKYGKTRYIPLLIIRIIALTLIIFAIAGMYILQESQSESYDMIIAIDSSSTMLADDLEPNRISAVKKSAIDIIENMEPRSRIGIISFSATTKVHQYLTDKKPDLIRAIERIDITKHSSTDMSQAITTATNLLLETNNTPILIIYTDGQHNIGIPLEDALEYAKEKGIRILPIAVGTDDGGQIEGINIHFGLNTKNLELLSKNQNNTYNSLKNEKKLNIIKEDSTTIHTFRVTIDRYLLYAALIILFFEFVLVKTIFKITP
jgi:Ca-activated chloride channel homolog